MARTGGSGNDNAWSVGVSPDGSTVFVTGYSTNYPGGPYLVSVAYSAATGARVWTASHPSFGGVPGPWLAVAPAGDRVFVTGWFTGPNGRADYGTIAYDSVTGAQLWEAAYDAAGGIDSPEGLAVSPDGSRVYVTGVSDTPETGVDYATVSYDAATGEELWVARYTGGAYDIAVSPDGTGVYVTGSTTGGLGTIAYDAITGAQRWVAIYPGQPFAHGYALAVSPDGTRVYAVGERGYDYATVAYVAATGIQVWASNPPGPYGLDEAQDVGVSPDGTRVYVTGESTGSNGSWDYGTFAYAAGTGRVLATHRYDGPGHQNDGPGGLAVSPDGTALYVTGSSYISRARQEDYTTIVYPLP